LAAIPAALLNRLSAVPFLVVAMLTTMVAIRFRRRMELARKAESEALAAAGARSYIGFHLQRVNGLLQGQHNRQHLATAAEAHRNAAARWQALAGEVAAEWAPTLPERIGTRATRPAAAGRAAPELASPGLRAV